MAIITLDDAQKQQQLDPQQSDNQRNSDRDTIKLEKLLNQKFRQEEIIMRGQAGQILLGLYGANKQVAIARLNNCLTLFTQQESTENQPSPVKFKLSVAQYPEDGDTVSTLYQYADSSPYQNCVI